MSQLILTLDNFSPLDPIIKWAGGKQKELKYILPAAPKDMDDFYEPFVGGGSVFAAFKARHYYINDFSIELYRLYRAIADQDAGFFKYMCAINESWCALLGFCKAHSDLMGAYQAYRKGALEDAQLKVRIRDFLCAHECALCGILCEEFRGDGERFVAELRENVPRKLLRMRALELTHGDMPDSDVFDNIETAFMGGLYFYYRGLYNRNDIKQNEALATALFVFIRNYAYSSMFRYNANGEFNVPYGGISYNHKLMTPKIEYYRSRTLIDRFENTTICNLDFEEFLTQNPPSERDFVFLDPPYDSEFSTYAQNAFTAEDQRRLAEFMIHRCKAKWMLVIKYTPFIYSLYDHDGLNIRAFDKKYLVSFMNRNDQNTEHLLITNY